MYKSNLAEIKYRKPEEPKTPIGNVGLPDKDRKPGQEAKLIVIPGYIFPAEFYQKLADK